MFLSAILVAATCRLAVAPPTAPPAAPTSDAPTSNALQSLNRHLQAESAKHVDLSEGDALNRLAAQPFASTPLTAAEASAARTMLWSAYRASAKDARAKELASGVITVNGVSMPIFFATYGKPEGASKVHQGRRMWISMHGGGGAPKEVNDKQWENQKKLYQPAEGVYVAPRAPTNEWNLWHQDHIDGLFARLIQDMVIAQDVDPDRVYILGYSAGGDGVYQLAPRMADRWAAAAMMAGHPNDAKPDSLRNTPFALHVGANDTAYDRNKVGAQWKEQLDTLQAADPAGYKHVVEIHAGKGHWMDREDASALPWMAKCERDLRPNRIVWLQDDVVQPRFYWLAVDAPKGGARIVAERNDQNITVVENTSAGPLRIRLDDNMCLLDDPVTVKQGDAVLFSGKAPRTIATIARTLQERGDPAGMFSAEVVVTPSASPATAAAPVSPASAAFDKMKSLAGTWEGNINGDAKSPTKVSYRVIANGSAVVETLFAGTDHEMETIFHLDGTRLLCTHYCAAGNQPRLNATAIEPSSMSFEMVDATNLPDRNAPHMGALRIDFVDANHIKTSWKSFANGQVNEGASFDLTRAK